MSTRSFVLAAILAIAGAAYAQHDDKHDSKHDSKHDHHDSRQHDQHANKVVQRHPLIFHSHVPPPGHRKSHNHKLHKVWVVPHWDKHHKHMIKGRWIWK